MIYQGEIVIATRGRKTIEITDTIRDKVKEARASAGICSLFLKHTSASIIVCENADPTVREDLEQYMARLVPDGDKIFKHNAEGIDDMPAHIRTILTQSSLVIPITEGNLTLGTWQGIYVWEHRFQSHSRYLTITVIGE